MKKLFLALLLFCFTFVSGCGQDEKVELTEPVEREKVAPVTQVPVPVLAPEPVKPIEEQEVVEQGSIERIDEAIEKEVDKEQESIEKIDKAIEDEVDKGKLDIEKIKETIEEIAPETKEKVTTEVEEIKEKVSPEELMKKTDDEPEEEDTK